MNLHEYQAKALLASYSVPVPEGRPAASPAQARTRAEEIGGAPWMVKAQVHAGGRGKAGGIRRAEAPEEVFKIAGEMLGRSLVTAQTTEEGQPINTVLIERVGAVERELYLSLLVDRSRAQVAIVASAAGGMDIEEVAASEPGRIVTEFVDPAAGLQAYQVRRIAFALGLDPAERKELATLLLALYRLFVDKDLSLLEVNPLVTGGGRLFALDAKINIDDNALYRHPDLALLRDASQEDEKETRARNFDLSYIALDGNIACMVNGAGLAMGTMDIIKLHGGEPANFLDVGGGTDAGKVAEAFKLIVSDSRVEAIPGQHIRWHRALRPHRGGHHSGGRRGGRVGAGGRAAGRHQRRSGAGAARAKRTVHHPRLLAFRRGGKGGRCGGRIEPAVNSGPRPGGTTPHCRGER